MTRDLMAGLGYCEAYKVREGLIPCIQGTYSYLLATCTANTSNMIVSHNAIFSKEPDQKTDCRIELP